MLSLTKYAFHEGIEHDCDSVPTGEEEKQFEKCEKRIQYGEEFTCEGKKGAQYFYHSNGYFQYEDP